MFLKDKLTNAIPNLDNWIMEFVRLDRFRGLSGNKQISRLWSYVSGKINILFNDKTRFYGTGV